MKVSIIHDKDLGKVVDAVSTDDLYELASVISTSNWSPGEFNAGRRTNPTFKSTEIFAIDIDEGCTLDQAKAIFKDFKHIIGTSRSHQRKKNGVVADRFRVVLFLDTPIDSDADFKATFAYARGLWPFIDEACKDAARFFYPSPQIISVNETGVTIEKQIASLPVSVPRVAAPNGERGELWKSTLKLLVEGAKAGQRHAALVKATGNMLEQGYTEDEIIARVNEMAEKVYPDGWATPHINDNDLKTIRRMSGRDLKYSFKEETKTEEQPSYLSANELLGEAISYLSDKEGVKGEPTGIEGLDKLLGGGFRKGELTVLMAQAKTGKNTMFHYLLHSFLKRNIAQGYASRELSPANEVLPNLLSIELGMNTWEEEITEELKAKFKKATESWELYFAPGYGHFPEEEMLTWFKTMKSIGVDFFLFDHFHYALLKEDYDATSKLIKQLKSLTKELDIHISLIVQPRSMRDDERLGLATLRGGAAIGQALDNLLILERVKDVTAENISQLTLEVARHKLAKPGKIYLQYDPKTTRMAEVDKKLVGPKTPQANPYDRQFPPGVKPSTAFNKKSFIFNED